MTDEEAEQKKKELVERGAEHATPQPGMDESPEQVAAALQREQAQQEIELRRDEFKQTLKLRGKYGNRLLLAMAIQLGIANVVFVGYAFAVGFAIPSSVMIAWLSATVVQVIGVVLAIVRGLFPPNRKDS